MTDYISYEQSVHWLRSQPQYEALVGNAYLDADVLAASERFASSEEFAETHRILGLDGSNPMRILDLGAGNGIATYAFAKQGHRVTAVEPGNHQAWPDRCT